MKIGFVTQWFPPEPGTFVAEGMARGLASRGHEVHVVTGFPNYPDGILQPGFPLRPYRRDTLTPGVAVHRAPMYPSHDASTARRVTNYVSFAGSATAVALTKVPKVDAWLVYSSPATAAIPAMLGNRHRGVPVHLVIQDLWPDSVTDSGFLGGRSGRFAEAALTSFCNWTYRRATRIGVISPEMRTTLVARGVPPDKIFDTPNWAPSPTPTSTSESSREALALPAGPLFLYAGNLGGMQGLEPLVRAFELVPEAALVLMGEGVAKKDIEAIVRERKLTNVVMLGHRPSTEVAPYLRTADAHVVSLQPTDLLRATMPSKTQMALSLGKPILAHAAGAVADLVTESGTGLVAPPGDLEATVAALKSFVELDPSAWAEMSQNASRLFKERFSESAGLDRLEALIAPTEERSQQ